MKKLSCPYCGSPAVVLSDFGVKYDPLSAPSNNELIQVLLSARAELKTAFHLVGSNTARGEIKLTLDRIETALKNANYTLKP